MKSKPIFPLAKTAAKKRVAFCEGQEERVLRAAQILSNLCCRVPPCTVHAD